MVPLGISSAAAVSVGRALGAGDRRGAPGAGWTALGLGVVFEIFPLFRFLCFRIRSPGFIRRTRGWFLSPSHCSPSLPSSSFSTASRLSPPGPCADRQYAHANGLESAWILGHRATRGLLALLQPPLGRGRALGWPVFGFDTDWIGFNGCVGERVQALDKNALRFYHVKRIRFTDRPESNPHERNPNQYEHSHYSRSIPGSTPLRRRGHPHDERAARQPAVVAGRRHLETEEA